MKEAFDKYINSYKEICPELTEKELDFIRINLTVSEFKKGQFYLKRGFIQKEMGFVFSGLLRSYYIDYNGKKITIDFIYENKYASDYPSFIRQKPSKYFIEVLEPTIIVNLPYIKIQEAYSSFKNFEHYGRLIAEQILIQKQDRIEHFLFTNAEERYLDFIKKNQNIMNRISLSNVFLFRY